MKSMIQELNVLCNACGCAGQGAIVSQLTEMLRPLMDEVRVDALGNVLAYRYAQTEQAETVMIEAHLDEIGFLVTHIDERGFVFVAPVGGADKRVLAAQQVVVYGEKPFRGVFSSVPPHLAGETNKIPAIEEMAIDVGLDADTAKSQIPIGSRVCFAPNFTLLGDTVVSSKSLDNRAGIAAVLYCIRSLKTRHLNVAVAFSVQEELGCRGAAVAARGIEPQYAIVTDVSFAHTRDANPRQCGEMRKGAMIGLSPVLDAQMCDELQILAQEKGIPYQFEVMSGSTGTDADNISVSCRGVKTALLSIPLRYMHTPIETVDMSDIIAVGDLMAAWIDKKGSATNG